MSVVQWKQVATTGSTTGETTAAANFNGSDYILIFVALAANNLTGVSDSQGNTWTLIGSDTASDTTKCRWVYRCINPKTSGAQTFSSSFTSTTGCGLIAVGLSGRDIESATPTFGLEGASGTSHAISTVSNCGVDDDIVAASCGPLTATNSTFTAGAGWTRFAGQPAGGEFSGQTWNTPNAIVNVSIQNKFTTTTSQVWADAVVVVRRRVTPTPPPPPRTLRQHAYWLNRRSREIFNNPSATTQYTQTVSASQASSAAMGPEQVGAIRSVSQAEVLTLARAAARSITLSSATAATSIKGVITSLPSINQASGSTMVKRAGLVRSATVTALTSFGPQSLFVGKSISQASSLSLIKAIVSSKLNTVLQASVATAFKQVGSSKAIAQSSVASLVRMGVKVFSLTQASVATLPSRVIGRVLTITESTAISLVKACTRSLALSQSLISSLAKSVANLKSITQSSTASGLKRVGKFLSLSQSTASSLQSIHHALVTLVVMVGTGITLIKSVQTIRSTTEAVSSSLVKTVGWIRSIATTVTASLTSVKAKLLTLTVSIASSSVLVKVVGWIRSNAQTSTAIAVKSVLRALSVAQSTSRSLVKLVSTMVSATTSGASSLIKSYARSFLLTQSIVIAVVRSVNRLIGPIAEPTSSSISKQVGKLLNVVQASGATLIRAVRTLYNTSQATVVSLVKSVGKILSSTVSQVAVLTRGGAANFMTVVTSITVPASLIKLVEASRSVSVSQVLNLVRSIGRTLIATAENVTVVIATTAKDVRTIVASVATSSILSKTVTSIRSAVINQSLSLGRMVGVVRGPILVVTLSLTRSITHSVAAAITSSFVLVKSIKKSLSLIVESTIAVLIETAKEVRTLVASVATSASLSRVVYAIRGVSVVAQGAVVKLISWFRTMVQASVALVSRTRIITLAASVATIATLTALFEKFYGATQVVRELPMVARAVTQIRTVRAVALSVSAEAAKFVARALRFRVSDKGDDQE